MQDNHPVEISTQPSTSAPISTIQSTHRLRPPQGQIIPNVVVGQIERILGQPQGKEESFMSPVGDEEVGSGSITLGFSTESSQSDREVGPVWTESSPPAEHREVQGFDN